MPSDKNLEGRRKLLDQLAERVVRLGRAASSDRERAWEEYSAGSGKAISGFVNGTLEVDGDLIEQIAQDLCLDRISKMNIDRAMEILHRNRWFDRPYVTD